MRRSFSVKCQPCIPLHQQVKDARLVEVLENLMFFFLKPPGFWGTSFRKHLLSLAIYLQQWSCGCKVAQDSQENPPILSAAPRPIRRR